MDPEGAVAWQEREWTAEQLGELTRLAKA
jgi:hypothetical protein